MSGLSSSKPELMPSLKQKIFGLNGARVYGVDVPERRRRTEVDPIGTRKQAYRNGGSDFRDLRTQDGF